MKIEKAALLGAGAVGAYFIWGLSDKMGERFSVAARGERKERLKREGLVINGRQYALSVKEPDELRDVDLLLVSSKQDALADALPDIKAMVGKNTMVVSLLNGVSSEEIIGNAVGMEHMLYAVMRIASVRKGREITFSPEHTGGLYVGEKDAHEPTERILALEELFKDTQINCHFVENIMSDIWMKYASNVAQNLPQAVLGVGFRAYKDSRHMYHIAKRLWSEVEKVACAKGIPIEKELVLFRGVKRDARFSTLQDLDAGRRTEIEMFAGDMMRMGAEYGIEVPYCECMYHLIKALEEKNAGKFAY